MPIKIIIGASDNETEIFASQVRHLLDESGFGGEGAEIVRDSTLYLTKEIGNTDPADDIMLIRNDTNVVVESGKPVKIPQTSAIVEIMGRRYMSKIIVVEIIGINFKNIGINNSWMSPCFEHYLEHGEAAIFI